MASAIGSLEQGTAKPVARQNDGQALSDQEIATFDRQQVREAHPAYLARQRALAEIEGLKTASPYNWAIGIAFVVLVGIASYLLPNYKWGITVLLLIFLADAIARRVNKQILIAQKQQIIREWDIHSYLLSMAEKLDRIHDHR